MEPDARTPGHDPFDPAFAKKLRWGAVALVVLGLAVFAYFLVQAKQQESAAARWDELAAIQDQFEPELGQDPMFEDPAGVYTERRNRYAEALEAFLPKAEGSDDALASHTHYLLAKTYTDQFYASQDPAAAEARERYYERAKEEWEILRDRYPDFQANRLEFAPPDHGSVTRMVLSVLEANRSWAAEHFPDAKEPTTDTVVVFRTERGDLRMGLYPEDAPELTALFLERVRRGDYNDTYFFARTDEGTDEDPMRRTIRGGHPDVRDVAAFDATAAAAFDEEESTVNLLPAPSRYKIAAARGVVACWHDPADPYDGSQQILVCTERSPQLDYNYSPIGRLVDEPSRATASRIFESETWGDKTFDEPPAQMDAIRDVFRVPVRIVKALAYENGALLAPTSTMDVDASEQTLDGLVRDAYRTEPPAASD